jgi:hypothetical protein
MEYSVMVLVLLDCHNSNAGGEYQTKSSSVCCPLCVLDFFSRQFLEVPE